MRKPSLPDAVLEWTPQLETSAREFDDDSVAPTSAVEDLSSPCRFRLSAVAFQNVRCEEVLYVVHND